LNKSRRIIVFLPYGKSKTKENSLSFTTRFSDVLQGAAREGGMQGVIISVTKVKVTVDLSIAKVYLSIFPLKKPKL
jgi:ribosome-binding factor A